MPRRNRTQKHQPYTTTDPCREKRRFPSEQAAQTAAETQELFDQRLDLTVYKCDHCSKWHLTRRKNWQ